MTGVLVSLLVHVAFALVFLRREPILPALPVVVDVSFELPERPKEIQKQLVSPSDRSKPEEPKDAKFLSERDSSVEKESIRRGDAPEAGPRIGKSNASPPLSSQSAERPRRPETAAGKTAPKPPKEISKPTGRRLGSLSLDSSTLLRKFGEDEREPSLDESITGQGARALSGYKAFSRPSGSGAAFLGVAGSNDFLPHLPDGDITLLNAKAEKFAVFVRRVATQVFSQLRLSGWESLRRSDIDSMRGFSTVIAVMGLDGALRSVVLEDASGSQRFDLVLKDAVKKGARDSNPPRDAAASDGNIRFVFKARTWSMAGADPRTGAPFERRWLLLATGLD